jgi:acyl-CoA dehydrogenase
MADFTLTTDQGDLVNLAAKFAKNEMSPVAAKFDKERAFPHEIYLKLFQLGLMNPRIPGDYGGAGLGLFDECLLTEEFAYACAGMTTTMIATSTALDTIIHNGTPEQKQEFLPPFTRELAFASFCLTEPDFGSDAGSLTTHAKREGDSYIINGSKRFVTNAPHSALFIVFATVDSSKKRHGISAFAVPKESDGLFIGKELGRMGHRASSTADVGFNNVKVPAGNLLGKEGDGLKIALATLNRTRTLIASAAVGLARSAMDYALDYSLKRVQFDTPIANFEATQLKIANMAQDITASRLLAWNAAMKLDKCEDAAKESTYAKCFASDMAMKTAIEAVQIYGGYGYTKDYPVEKLMRDAKLLQIFGGVNEILKLGVARQMIKSKT